jgi:putative membrane protein
MTDMNTLAHWHDGAGPGPWILFFPLVWVLVVGAVFLLRRVVWRGGRGLGPYRDVGPYGGDNRHVQQESSPIAVLGRRFATGEIDEDEYGRRLSVLQESGPRPGGATK